jgi:hypothetical protein
MQPAGASKGRDYCSQGRLLVGGSWSGPAAGARGGVRPWRRGRARAGRSEGGSLLPDDELGGSGVGVVGKGLVPDLGRIDEHAWFLNLYPALIAFGIAKQQR